MSRWRELAPEQRRAAQAAALMALTLLLPWYTATSVQRGQPDRSLSAFAVFSFVEAAVLLVAASVLYLLYARSERRAFHLPGGDGWAITAGGAWAAFLLVWRLFDKPDVDGAAVGVQWGMFVALATAGMLAAAGQRLRAAHRPEPPNPIADDGWERPRKRRRSDRREPVDPSAVSDVLRRRPPDWEGEPPEAPGRAPRGPRIRDRSEESTEVFREQPLWDDEAPTHVSPRDREPEDEAAPPPDRQDPGQPRLF